MDCQVILGDCLEVLKKFPDNSFDSIVTDPPYGFSFMGKEWDHGVPGCEFWTEIIRVSKPGAHILAFGGTRTHHRLMVAIEDSGWELRDCMSWLYGSGYPKSRDISKDIDKSLGIERVVKDIPVSEEAKTWEGWNIVLKPAWEPIILARKPLEGTIVENVLKWGTGGLNIDGCRIEGEPWTWGTQTNIKGGGYGTKRPSNGDIHAKNVESNPKGRWPANLVLDEQAAFLLDEQSGECGAFAPVKSGKSGKSKGIYGNFAQKGDDGKSFRGDSGGASRFFYTVKPTVAEKEKHLTGFVPKKVNDGRNTPIDNPYQRGETMRKNTHPTVKPVALLRYLCRLITPPGGTVLDPFCGSGGTGVAAFEEGFKYVLIDKDEEYYEISRMRNAGTRISDFYMQP